MVLQIRPDRRSVARHRNAVLLQHLGRSEPRQLQELRRTIDAAADDALALRAGHMRDAVAQELDAARPAVLNRDSRRMRVGADRQIRPPARLGQIGAGGAPAPLAVGGALERAGALLLAIGAIA